jgi:hypothetical protein
MKRFLTIFLLGFAVAGGLFAAFNYHFIRTSKGLVVERKSEAGFADTFADTREWGPIDYLKNPTVARALMRSGMKELTSESEKAADKAAKEAGRLLDESQKAVGEALEKAGKQLKR